VHDTRSVSDPWNSAKLWLVSRLTVGNIWRPWFMKKQYLYRGCIYNMTNWYTNIYIYVYTIYLLNSKNWFSTAKCQTKARGYIGYFSGIFSATLFYSPSGSKNCKQWQPSVTTVEARVSPNIINQEASTRLMWQSVHHSMELINRLVLLTLRQLTEKTVRQFWPLHPQGFSGW
jgi:hypothetical protein